MNKKVISLALSSIIMLSSATGLAAATTGNVYKLDGSLFATGNEMNASGLKRNQANAQQSQLLYGYDGKYYRMADANAAYVEAGRDMTVFATKIAQKQEVVVEEVSELKVVEVSAINGKEAVIKFTQPVKESTVITSNKLNASNITFTSLETPAKTITNASAEAKLSEDGKTLTITAQTTEVFEGRYQLIVKDVENTKFEKIEKYDEVINLGKDTVAPTVKSVEKVNASTTKVTFSEAIENLGSGSTLGTGLSLSYKLADGTVVPASDITLAIASDKKSVNVTANATKYRGKTIVVTMLGAKDQAGNLLNPNPSTFNVTVGEKDGVAPVVSSVKALNDTQLEITFSEEVQGLAFGDVTITGGSDVISPIPAASALKQDTVDKKKYVVTFASTILASEKNSALADVKVAKASITDLSGEAMANDYTTIVSVVKDTVAPKLVSTKVVKEGADQFVVMEFDKKLDPTVSTIATAVTVSGTNATSYKNYVTTTGTFAFGATAGDVVLTTDQTGMKVKLASATFGGNALVDGTDYTLDVTAKGSNGKTSDPIKVAFKYVASASIDKPALVTTNPIVVADPANTITIEFDKELDGASATTLSNYNINGVAVTKAVLAGVSSGTQKVTLTLGANSLTGNRAITISGVKAKNGAVMDTFNGTVALKENIAPTVTSAKVKSTTTIELTFSEDITVGANKFDVFLGNKATAETEVTNSAVSTAANKVVITLANPLTIDDLGRAITVKPASGIDAKDTANNLLDFKSILAVQ